MLEPKRSTKLAKAEARIEKIAKRGIQLSIPSLLSTNFLLAFLLTIILYEIERVQKNYKILINNYTFCYSNKLSY